MRIQEPESWYFIITKKYRGDLECETFLNLKLRFNLTKKIVKTAQKYHHAPQYNVENAVKGDHYKNFREINFLETSLVKTLI